MAEIIEDYSNGTIDNSGVQSTKPENDKAITVKMPGNSEQFNNYYDRLFDTNTTIGRTVVGKLVGDSQYGSVEDGERLSELGINEIETSQELDDAIADTQSGFELARNAMANNLVTAGTTALDGTIGEIYGWLAAAVTLEANAKWNNKFSNLMQDIRDYTSKNLYLARSSKYEDLDLWDRMKTGYFWANNVQSLGFTEGAILAGAVWSYFGAPGPVAQFMGASAEATTEAINDYREQHEELKKKLFEKYDILTQKYGHIYTPDQAMKQLVKEYATMEDDLQMAGNIQYAANVALLMLTNKLEGLDKFMTGGFDTRRTVLRYVKDNLKKVKTGEMSILEAIKPLTRPEATARAVGKSLLRGATEGFEEGAQGIISETPKQMSSLHRVESIFDAPADLSPEEQQAYREKNWVSGKRDYARFSYDNDNIEFGNKIGEFCNAMVKACSEKWDDTNWWEEIASGFVTGVTGAPGFARRRNGQGLTIGWNGSIINDINEMNAVADRSQEFVNNLNERVKDGKFAAYYNGLARKLALNNKMEIALENNNKREYKNAEFEEELNDLFMFSDAGQMDMYKDMVKAYTELRKDDIAGITEHIKELEEGLAAGKVINDYGELIDRPGRVSLDDKVIESIRRKSEGKSEAEILNDIKSAEDSLNDKMDRQFKEREDSLRATISKFKGKSEDEILKDVKENAKKHLDAIDSFNKSVEQVERWAPELSGDNKKAAVFYAQQLENRNKRISDIAGQIHDYIKKKFPAGHVFNNALLNDALKTAKDEWVTNFWNRRSKLDEHLENLRNAYMEILGEMAEIDDSGKLRIKDMDLYEANEFFRDEANLAADAMYYNAKLSEVLNGNVADEEKSREEVKAEIKSKEDEKGYKAYVDILDSTIKDIATFVEALNKLDEDLKNGVIDKDTHDRIKDYLFSGSATDAINKAALEYTKFDDFWNNVMKLHSRGINIGGFLRWWGPNKSEHSIDNARDLMMMCDDTTRNDEVNALVDEYNDTCRTDRKKITTATDVENLKKDLRESIRDVLGGTSSAPARGSGGSSSTSSTSSTSGGIATGGSSSPSSTGGAGGGTGSSTGTGTGSASPATGGGASTGSGSTTGSTGASGGSSTGGASGTGAAAAGGTTGGTGGSSAGTAGGGAAGAVGGPSTSGSLVGDSAKESSKNVFRAFAFAESRVGRNLRKSANPERTSNLDDVQRIFFDNNNGKGKLYNKALFDKVVAVARELGIKVEFTNSKFTGDQQGLYSSGTIYLRSDFFDSNLGSNNTEKARVILHELIHACTVYALDAVNNHKTQGLSNRAIEACKSLNRVFDEIKNDPVLSKEYGSKNAMEMVAELSNAGFRKKLKQRSSARKLNWFQRIVDAIKKFFGIGDSSTKLYNDDIEKALFDLLDNYNPKLFEMYRISNSNRFYAEVDYEKINTFINYIAKQITDIKKKGHYGNDLVDVFKHIVETGLNADDITDEVKAKALKNLINHFPNVANTINTAERLAGVTDGFAIFDKNKFKEFVNSLGYDLYGNPILGEGDSVVEVDDDIEEEDSREDKEEEDEKPEAKDDSSLTPSGRDNLYKEGAPWMSGCTMETEREEVDGRIDNLLPFDAHDKNKKYRYIYSYLRLKSNHSEKVGGIDSFTYLDLGLLKPGDKIVYYVDPAFEKGKEAAISRGEYTNEKYGKYVTVFVGKEVVVDGETKIQPLGTLSNMKYTKDRTDNPSELISILNGLYHDEKNNDKDIIVFGVDQKRTSNGINGKANTVYATRRGRLRLFTDIDKDRANERKRREGYYNQFFTDEQKQISNFDPRNKKGEEMEYHNATYFMDQIQKANEIARRFGSSIEGDIEYNGSKFYLVVKCDEREINRIRLFVSNTREIGVDRLIGTKKQKGIIQKEIAEIRKILGNNNVPDSADDSTLADTAEKLIKALNIPWNKIRRKIKLNGHDIHVVRNAAEKTVSVYVSSNDANKGGKKNNILQISSNPTSEQVDEFISGLLEIMKKRAMPIKLNKFNDAKEHTELLYASVASVIPSDTYFLMNSATVETKDGKKTFIFETAKEESYSGNFKNRVINDGSKVSIDNTEYIEYDGKIYTSEGNEASGNVQDKYLNAIKPASDWVSNITDAVKDNIEDIEFDRGDKEANKRYVDVVYKDEGANKYIKIGNEELIIWSSNGMKYFIRKKGDRTTCTTNANRQMFHNFIYWDLANNSISDCISKHKALIKDIDLKLRDPANIAEFAKDIINKSGRGISNSDKIKELTIIRNQAEWLHSKSKNNKGYDEATYQEGIRTIDEYINILKNNGAIDADKESIGDQLFDHMRQSLGDVVTDKQETGISKNIEDPDISLAISKRNKETIKGWINKGVGKLRGMTDEQIDDVLDLIDQNFTNGAEHLAVGKWFANGNIAGEQDFDKCRQALATARKAKTDPSQYNGPMDLMESLADFIPSEKPIDPDTVPTLRNKRVVGNGIVVYDVDESEESRQNMRAIINTHFGKECSPWCLLQGDGNGNLTEDSKRYWEHYNAYPKQVAFANGKLVAFCANDTDARKWWDRQDEWHVDIPVLHSIPNDKLGRVGTYLYNEQTGEVKERPINIHKGNRKNGIYELWYDLDYIAERTNYKNGKKEGLYEEWWKNGKIKTRTNYIHGLIDGLYESWNITGTKGLSIEYSDGKKSGESRLYYKKGGGLFHFSVYKNGKLNGESLYYNPDGSVYLKQFYKNGELINEEITNRRRLEKDDSQDNEYFKTPEGEVYGYYNRKTGKIYIDKKHLSDHPDTPLHEYTHLWDRVIQKHNPELWAKGVYLMSEYAHVLWTQVEGDENYGKRWKERLNNGEIDMEEYVNLIASEVHARLVGEHGIEWINSIYNKSNNKGLIQQLIDWIKDAWKSLADTFGISRREIDKLSLKDFNNMTLRDFVINTDIQKQADEWEKAKPSEKVDENSHMNIDDFLKKMEDIDSDVYMVIPFSASEPRGGVGEQDINIYDYETGNITGKFSKPDRVFKNGRSKIINFADRKIIVLNFNGFNIPFYCSSGHGGKKGVEAGQWYPFFGLYSEKGDAWLNKLTEDDINDYYGSTELKAICEKLDSTFGDIRNNDVVGSEKIGKLGIPRKMTLDVLNKDITPAENKKSDSKDKVLSQVNKVKEHLSKYFGTSSTASTKPQQQIQPDVQDEEEEEEDNGNELLRVVDDTIPFKKIDIGREVDVIDSILPNLRKNVRVEVKNDILRASEKGVEAWGNYKRSLITLSNEAAEGTLYHEAFHAVMDLSLSDDEKNNILKEASKRWRTNDRDRLEELLAEAFREHVTTEIADDSLGGAIKRFFTRLFHAVKMMLGHESKIDSLFYAITNGKRTSMSFEYRPLKSSVTEKSVTTTKFDNINAYEKSNLEDIGMTREQFESHNEIEKYYLATCGGVA